MKRLHWLVEIMHSIRVEAGSLKLAEVSVTHWDSGYGLDGPAMKALEDLTGHRPRLHVL